MISIDETFARYALALRPLASETLPISQALNRVLASDVHAATDLPRFDQSAMDGYAFRAGDVAGASQATPVLLPIAQQLPAQAYAGAPQLAASSVARILTGAPIPSGADTVIPQERIERVADQLRFTEPYPANRNIRWRGEELKSGERIAEAGQRIGPGLLAALINADLERLTVQRRPRIRVLVSGDEVRPVGTPLAFGEIHDSNGPMVGAVLAGWGLAPASIAPVSDHPDAVREALSAAIHDADLVITCGGASVGDKDYLPATARQLGVQEVFWQVAQKPGKPMWFGTHPGGAVLALPGNPGAVLIGLVLHARTIINHLESQLSPGPRWAIGRLDAPVECDNRRERLLRMRLHHDADGVAHLSPLANQDSHMLGNLASADVLVRVPVGTEVLGSGTKLPWTGLP
jgi:molybdopterin molybdotransferase